MAISQDQIDSMYGMDVVDESGDKVGSVGQVYLDDTTGDPAWVTVKTGLFGTKETFVPLAAASLSGGSVRVPYSKSYIKDAPNTDADGHITDAEQDELYRYYNVGAGTSGMATTGGYDTDTDRAAYTDTAYTGAGTETSYTDTDRTTGGDRMTLHEEQVNVGTERVESGRVRLRKHTVTEQRTVTVPVEREEVELVREPATGTGTGDIGDDEVEVTLHQERPVVDKDVVATEEVGLQRRTVEEQQQVTTDVSREEVDVERDGGTRSRDNY